MERTSASGAGASTIGGHYPAIIDERRHAPPGHYGYESARSALFALVKTLAPSRVYVPNYICSAVPSALNHADCRVERFSIDENFRIAEKLELGERDLIVLVNYFGLCSQVIEAQLQTLPRNAVVVDNSQAFFQQPFDCLASVYSPRKFLPVADGGFIDTRVELAAEAADEAASLERFGYLLKRVGSEPEPSRQDYLAAEHSLETPTLRRMSSLTLRMACAVDQEFIATRRRANYNALGKLSRINRLDLDIGSQVPLCYPLMVEDGRRLRSELIARRIFAPHYWPEVIPTNEAERRLSEDTVFIPIDHRYSPDDMEHLAGIIFDVVGGVVR